MLKMKKITDLGNLSQEEYFDTSIRLSLDDCNNYFRELLKLMVDFYHPNKTNAKKIESLLKDFKHKNLSNQEINVMDLMLKIKECNLLPSICFQMNNISCFKIAMKLLD